MLKPENLAQPKIPTFTPAPPISASDMMDSYTISSLISQGVCEALKSQSNYRQPNIVINNGSQKNHKKKPKIRKKPKVNRTLNSSRN